MKTSNILLTFIFICLFTTINAQKNSVSKSLTKNTLFEVIQQHKLNKKADPINTEPQLCASLKLSVNRLKEQLMLNTYKIGGIGYVNEEGIVINTGKKMKLVLWYATYKGNS